MRPSKQLRRRRVVGLAIVGSTLALTACPNTTNRTSPTTSTPSSTSSTSPGRATGADGSAPGKRLGVRLSEGTAATAAKLARVAGTPLDAASTQAIIDRLPAWVDDGSIATAFNWPVESLPVPRPGRTIDQLFPAPAVSTPPTVVTGPVKVLRAQPDGDVPIAPFVSITFNQDMVPIATVDQVEAGAPPARISPDVPGSWRWVGTRTLRFDAGSSAAVGGADRLPMATDYRVDVLGGADTSFTFRTPPVTLQSFQPADGDIRREPIFVAAFDQRIDPAAVLATIKLTADGGSYPVRLATPDEIAADPLVRTSGLGDGRWLAFRPIEALPTDTAIAVAIGPGTPSAEGPRTTTEAQKRSLRTYAPLKVVRRECTYGPSCPPQTGVSIEMNNPIDTAVFDPATITVEPALSGQSIGTGGNIITIAGATVARTSYEVTLPKSLTDVYGQQLGEATAVKFDVGPAQPILRPFEQPVVTLDPLAPTPSLTIGTVNHDEVRVRIYEVAPPDWPAFEAFAIEAGGQDGLPDVPWRAASNRTVAVKGDSDRFVETEIDLSKALGNDRLGHLVVIIEPTKKYPADSELHWMNRPTFAWVQSTRLGVDGFRDPRQVKVWVTDLTTGAPMADVAVGTLRSPQPVSTGPDGLVTLDLTGGPVDVVVATGGSDVAILAPPYIGGGNEWTSAPLFDETRWFVMDDRHTYRPGETVSVKGWLRQFETSGDAQLHMIRARSVHFQVMDGRGVSLTEGDAALNRFGGFDLSFGIPAGANLGHAFVQLTLSNASNEPYSAWAHSFQIQDFRRPEFEVTARPESAGPHLSSAPATVAVDANYYAGGALGAAPVKWLVSTSSASYSPPGWDAFTFGEWTPWWFAASSFPKGGRFGGEFIDEACCPGRSGETKVEEFSGSTDGAGHHFLQVDFVKADGGLPDLPTSVVARASVEDVNRQAWASSTTLLVHPGELYVGLRGSRTFVRQGDPLDIEAIVTDIDGKLVAARAVTLSASRMEWGFKNGQWSESAVSTTTCDTVSAGRPVTCSFAAPLGGTYSISSTVTDDRGGRSRSELTRWVSGGEARPSRNLAREELTIVPAQKESAPGSEVEVLVLAPFATGHGLMTVSRVGIESTLQFDVVDGSAVVRVPIADRDIPGVNLAFEVVGVTPRTGDDGRPMPNAPPRPAFAVGSVYLPVSVATRTLTVKAAARVTQVVPKATTQIDVSVTDAAGAAVSGAEFVIVVVDEAVLALSSQGFGNPLDAFYAPVNSFTEQRLGRETIVLANPEVVVSDVGVNETMTAGGAATTGAAATSGAPAGVEQSAADSAFTSKASSDSALGGSGSATTTAIDTRTNFDALALYRPSIVTDAAGRASVDVTMPDNLTRYRILVVAVSGDDRFGSVESTLTARLPLTVRPSAPRFANFGDAFELPVIVQNQTGQPMSVDLVAQGANLGIPVGGQRVLVPANDRIEVRFSASTKDVGVARVRVAAVSGAAADAATVEFPVYTPATAEAFATYGVIDDGAVAQPVLAPTGVIPQFGGLDITTSSTAIQGLTDAVLYLVNYPYDSADGRASRILTVTALRGVLEAFRSPDLPSPARLDAAVAADIEAITKLQNPDGGFAYWTSNRPSEPYVTVAVAHALVAAQAGGSSVPADTLARALGYLADIEPYVAKYSEAVRDTISAYALSVRAQAGQRDAQKAKALWDRRGDKLPLEAAAWLWPIIDHASTGEAIERRIQNAAVETAGAANFTTSYGDDAYVVLNSERRVDALVLDALIAERPNSTLIPKVVAGLLGHRTAGRWEGAQENTFILLALKRYFDTYEAQTPNFTANLWLGNRFAGGQEFAGRSVDRNRVSIPTVDLVAGGKTQVVVSKDGTGRLYYRMGLRYAPSDLKVAPLDRGFAVTRSYDAIDDPSDVTRSADGVWHVKAGARVRVRVTMSAESQRTHVALIDSIPAGFEIVNPDLATSVGVPPDQKDPNSPNASTLPVERFWYGQWFDHQNRRDDRAEAFATLLPAGTYDYSYVARATTPGTFVVPPARAEQIYEPETFGRSGSLKVVISDV